MDSYIQLISLIGSFIYGILLYYCNRFNYNIIVKKSIIGKLLISILYLFNVSLLYVCFLYKLNSGFLHVYNILFIVIGYIIFSVKRRKS